MYRDLSNYCCSEKKRKEKKTLMYNYIVFHREKENA